ncbi:hypothetical protein B0H11DRAFT_2006546 [Mycena galericulata]|nr:hypothetical protein B0H11DRAFT_2006546 [Mycena galericulata]
MIITKDSSSSRTTRPKVRVNSSAKILPIFGRPCRKSKRFLTLIRPGGPQQAQGGYYPQQPQNSYQQGGYQGQPQYQGPPQGYPQQGYQPNPGPQTIYVQQPAQQQSGGSGGCMACLAGMCLCCCAEEVCECLF